MPSAASAPRRATGEAALLHVARAVGTAVLCADGGRVEFGKAIEKELGEGVIRLANPRLQLPAALPPTPAVVAAPSALLLPLLPTLFQLAARGAPVTVFVRLAFADAAKASAVRGTGCAVWFAATPQEVADVGIAAHAAARATGVPAVVFVREQAADAEEEVTLADPADVAAAFPEPAAPPAEEKAGVLRRRTENPELAAYPARFAEVAAALKAKGLISAVPLPVAYSGSDDAAAVLVVPGALSPAIRELAKGDSSGSLGVASLNLLRPWPEPALLELLASHKRVRAVGVVETEGDALFADVCASLATLPSPPAAHQIHLLSPTLAATYVPTLLSALAAPGPAASPIALGTAAPSRGADFRRGFDPSAPEAGYMKMLSQLFGDRLVVGNAPRYKSAWGVRVEGQGEEDRTVEFGLGVLEERARARKEFVVKARKEAESGVCPPALKGLIDEWATGSPAQAAEAADKITAFLAAEAWFASSPLAKLLSEHKHHLVPPSMWLLSGSTTAYDPASAGIAHLLKSPHPVKLVLVDTTPAGEQGGKKDLGLWAMQYGTAYVASCALGSSYSQLVRSIAEADAFDGPAVVLCYAPTVKADKPGQSAALAQLKEVKLAVDSGKWPLYRWDPQQERFDLESEKLRIEVERFLEGRELLAQVTQARGGEGEWNADWERAMRGEFEAKARDTYEALLGGMKTEPLLILYGSDGGNAAGVAKKLAKQAKEFAFSPRVMPMDEYDAEGLPEEKHVCFVTSTAGQGEFPQNAREFWKFVGSTALDLRNVKFSVFSMGDRHYWPAPGDEHFFAKAGKDLDARIAKLGAQRLTECGVGDDQDPDGWLTGYSAWMPEFWSALGVEGVGPAGEPAVAPDDNIKEASNFLRGTINEGLVDGSTGGVMEWDQKLLKFHGIYQQDDRDIREERKNAGFEPAFSFMVRVRLPAGVCSTEQWLAMDRICEEHANGTIKITTRQTFQLHGIIKRHLKPAIQDMNRVLMDTIAACGDVNRTVMCGANPEQSEVHAQVYEFSKRWSEHMLPKSAAYHEIWLDKKPVMTSEEVEPIYGRTFLPRKFKTVVAVPPSNDVDIFAHDLGFIAIVEGTRVVGYNITVGGGMGMTHGNKKTYPRLADMLGYAPADRAIDVGEKVVLVQRDYGDRTNRKHARLKYTIDDRGIDWFRGEVEARLGYKLEPAKPFKFTENTDKYGWFKGLNDTWHFTFFITNGRVKDTPEQQMRTAIREIAKVHKGDFRLTPNQHLMIAGVPAAEKPRIQALLEKYGIDDSKKSGLRLSSMACVALPTCGLAFAESERYLPSLISRLEDAIEESGLMHDSIVIRMTGCPNGCARPYNAEIAFVGKAPGSYNVYLGGGHHGERLAKLFKESLGDDEIVAELSPLIKRYAVERQKGEPFGDWVIRAGIVKRVVVAKTDFHD
ncbi:hypothetical protein DFJ74DRAFT_665013 [Hyaloraphidium curvatum]|nr:hypothetical protein DFJ74DRAFT_665013 [Hyaloraphidium curvatum]